MTTTNDFSLRHLVRDVAENSTLTGPDAVAAEVLRRITEEDAPAALEQSLREFVRVFLVNARPAGSPLEASASSAPVKPQRSRKVAGIRDTWRAWLNAQYRVRDAWMRLGDCTVDDLVFISAELEAQAQKNMAKASGLRSLADALAQHRVERVRDLPESVLVATVGRDAA